MPSTKRQQYRYAISFIDIMEVTSVPFVSQFAACVSLSSHSSLTGPVFPIPLVVRTKQPHHLCFGISGRWVP